jgi:hypothetical protein
MIHSSPPSRLLGYFLYGARRKYPLLMSSPIGRSFALGSSSGQIVLRALS